jgi:hypothetical protein
VEREGRSAVIGVEIDRSIHPSPDTSRLEARIQGPDGAVRAVPLERVGEDRFEARVALEQAGVSLGVVRLAGDRVVSLPPLALPYSPEFERSFDPDRGERLLRDLARESGGLVAPAAADLFRGEREGRATRVIARELAIAAIALLLLEIAARRLELWSLVRVPAFARRWRAPQWLKHRATGTSPPAARELAPAPGTLAPPAASTTGAPPSIARAAPPSSPSTTPSPASPAASQAPTSPSPGDLASALTRAKKSAGKQLDR